MKPLFPNLRAATAMSALLALQACTATLPKSPELPQTPTAFREADSRWVQAAPADTQPRGNWWKSFADPALDQLVERATLNNTGIQAAAARLTKARAMARAADVNRMPQVGAGIAVNQQGGPLINAAGTNGTLWTLYGNASYEPDLFGRLSKELDAATLDAQSREALLQSTRLLIQADVAQSYFLLRAIDAERTMVRATLDTHRKTLRLAERRFDLGTVAELDVVRLRADLAVAESEALALDRRRAELEHALALLVGEVASTFRIAETASLDGPPPLIPPGVPSTVLTRRPDIAAAQRSMMAAQARVGVAQTAWMPNVVLTTGQGFASADLSDLVSSAARSSVWNLLLTLPVFDGGRRNAAIQGAEADFEAAAVNYREQILVAFKDVEDQLAALRLLADQDRVQRQAVDASSRTVALANSRYASGLASQLELLDAQRNELRNRRQALQVHAQRYQATVGLIRALGGDWSNTTAVTTGL